MRVHDRPWSNSQSYSNAETKYSVGSFVALHASQEGEGAVDPGREVVFVGKITRFLGLSDDGERYRVHYMDMVNGDYGGCWQVFQGKGATTVVLENVSWVWYSASLVLMLCVSSTWGTSSGTD